MLNKKLNMVNSGNNKELQYAFRLNENYHFDHFVNERQFFESAQRLIDEHYFLIVLGSLNKKDNEQHILLFFSQQYFPVQEIKGLLEKGAYFALRTDLFKGYSMRNRLKDFGYLEYSIQESKVLLDNDYRLIKNIFELVDKEAKMPASDIHSRILISYLNLLLQHMQRFYKGSMENRVNELQILHQDFINELQSLFDTGKKCMLLRPSLVLLSKKLDCTPRFLNDVSLKISKHTAQHHIDSFIVKIAKELLAETDLSVAEIAEKMQFSQPQSLTRIFKRKTRISPLDYRISII
ncbi:helix-turn-helix domain-containing protein [Sphingobacterium sp.]|uniref:helix-turn-helix domain-containing protein n=1 Tax=Sphingobacterium sp. TaxID=341027 RepID=UPI0028A282C1|nr:helix-turn-helix domain-containing protein [Sphingobacterium sp.]